MRIDKFLSNMGIASRTESAKTAKLGKLLVDGVPCKRCDIHILPEINIITYCGKKIIYREYTYIMLNKPSGYVSATDDPKEITVLELLPENLRKIGLFPCGRLDKNTLGLLILTNDGELSHKLLSPKHHVKKVYYFKSDLPITENDSVLLEKGVTLEDGYETKPSKIELLNNGDEGYITLTEGKYHQIKRMLKAIDNKIAYLERVEFADIQLDETLQRGEWRYLNNIEIQLLQK